MPIPDYQTLMLPVLSVAAEGEIRVPLAAQIIADQLGLTEDEREEMLPSGKQRLLHNRVHWAKFYMSKAGLIDSPKRGVGLGGQSPQKRERMAESRYDRFALPMIDIATELLSVPTEERDIMQPRKYRACRQQQ